MMTLRSFANNSILFFALCTAREGDSEGTICCLVSTTVNLNCIQHLAPIWKEKAIKS